MPSVSTCTFILTLRLWRAFGLKIWTNSPGESSIFNLHSTAAKICSKINPKFLSMESGRLNHNFSILNDSSLNINHLHMYTPHSTGGVHIYNHIYIHSNTILLILHSRTRLFIFPRPPQSTATIYIYTVNEYTQEMLRMRSLPHWLDESAYYVYAMIMLQQVSHI